MGNAHPSLFPYEAMPTADRDMIITAGNDRQFRALCEVLGIAEVADDPRFATNADRTGNREELRPLLLAELARWKADDLFVALNEAGAPCGPINTIGEGVELAESLGLAPRVELGADDRQVTLVRNPITFGDADLRYDLPPPELGEHSDEIKAWLRAPAMRRRPDELRPTDPGTGPASARPRPTRSRCSATTSPASCSAGSSFGELAFWLIAKRRPTPGAARAVRGGARRARRPRVHAHRPGGSADLRQRPRVAAGRGRGRAAGWRVAVPRRHRGRGAVPGRQTRRVR